MVKVISGKDYDGEPCEFYLDGYLKTNLDDVKDRVRNKNWDYVSIVCGIPGVGKSNFAQSCAKYCCEWFDKDYIAFTDEEFITISNNAPQYSSVVLDESFASLNSRVSNSKAFVRIINHLQLIRQKHLFIFLCLPNFFDLSKGVAIYRSSHLFLIYPDKEGNRGFFAAFDRETKRELYIKGQKFLNYYVVDANFTGKFTKQTCINEKVYDDMKMKHLLEQEKKEPERFSKAMKQRNYFINALYNEVGWSKEKIANTGKMSERWIRDIIKDER